jgi:2-keto-4-pentenoate hydratase/2-oxohepta-3-ene-1,7-dioic acid hydratase in catechol pathway
MKLVTFINENQESIGAIDDAGHIVDLHKAYAAHLGAAESNSHGDEMAAITLGRDMVEFLKRGPTTLEAARQAIAHGEKNPAKAFVIDRRQVRLMAPVPRPGALISAGKNFSDHVSEMSSKKGQAIRWHF